MAGLALVLAAVREGTTEFQANSPKPFEPHFLDMAQALDLANRAGLLRGFKAHSNSGGSVRECFSVEGLSAIGEKFVNDLSEYIPRQQRA